MHLLRLAANLLEKTAVPYCSDGMLFSIGYYSFDNSSHRDNNTQCRLISNNVKLLVIIICILFFNRLSIYNTRSVIKSRLTLRASDFYKLSTLSKLNHVKRSVCIL